MYNRILIQTYKTRFGWKCVPTGTVAAEKTASLCFGSELPEVVQVCILLSGVQPCACQEFIHCTQYSTNGLMKLGLIQFFVWARANVVG